MVAASLVLGSARSSRRRRPAGRSRPGRTGPRAAPGGPSSWACAGRSRGAWARERCRHRLMLGERVEPWRARPVPFWRNGLAPPPRTSARVLVDWVPALVPGELGGHHLVQHRPVGLEPEDLGRQVDRAQVVALGVALGGAPGHRRRTHFLDPVSEHRAQARRGGHWGALCRAHRVLPALLGVLTESRSTTTPPRAPGTAPLTSTSSRSGSACTTSRLSAVTWLPPMLAGHAGALEHPGRRGTRPDGARRAVVAVVAVRRTLAFEVVPLHAAGEALALGDRDGVDALAGLPEVSRDLLAHAVVGHVVEPELDERATRVDTRLGVVPRLGLGQGRVAPEPPGHLQCRVTVGLRRLDLDHAHGRDLEHRHRNGAVLVVPDLGHADLLADDRLACHVSSSCGPVLRSDCLSGRRRAPV